MNTRKLKISMAALLALVCVLSCGTTALAAEEWGILPDGYVLSVPPPDYTLLVKGKSSQKLESDPAPREDAPMAPEDGDTAVETPPSQPEEPLVEPPEAPVPEESAYTPEEFAAIHLAEINRIREENGLSLLTTDPTLTEMAQKRVEEYQSGHKRPNGTRWSTIFKEYDTTLNAVGENWIGAWDDPYGQMELLMGSKGHKANILRQNARYVGIGVKLHEDGSGISVIQLYAK